MIVFDEFGQPVVVEQEKARLTGLPEPKVSGAVVVFRNGRPDVCEDFIKHLTPEQRQGVENALAVHGFKLVGNEVMEIQ